MISFFAMRLSGIICMTLAVIMLGASVLGVTTTLGQYQKNKPPSTLLATNSLAKLNRIGKRYFIKSDREPEKIIKGLTHLTSLRFANGGPAYYNVFNNWFMVMTRYIPGLPGTLTIMHNPHDIVQFAQHAYCDKQALVLGMLARKHGINGRLALLDGHVVYEAYYDNKWHMYDPHQMVYIQDNGEVLGVNELAQLPKTTLNDHYDPYYIKAMQTQNNNKTMTIDELTKSRIVNNIITNRMLYADYIQYQQYARYIKWAVPVALFVIGAIQFSRAD